MLGLMNHRIDADDELRAWQEIQAEDAYEEFQNKSYHRCPSDIPPCPECQELDDIECADES